MSVLHAREISSVQDLDSRYLYHHHGSTQHVTRVVTPESHPIHLNLLGGYRRSGGCIYIYVRHKVRIRTILGFSCANPQIARNILRKPHPRVAVSPRLCCLCQLAGALPAMGAACRSLFAFAQGYAVWRLGTRVRILATRSDTRLP